MSAMRIAYCSEWERSEERYRAFWANEALDRPAIYLTAPREEPLPGPPRPAPPDDWLRYWTDIEYVIARADYTFRHTEYFAEAFPNLWINFGPGIVAAYLGARIACDASTVWFHPIIRDWETAKLRLEPENWWWKRTQEITRAAVEFGAGKFFVGITDLGGVSDVLASLRGSAQLQMDFLLNPELVARSLRTITEYWKSCYEALYRIMDERMVGSAQFLNLWSPRRMYNIQSDLCCMISPQLFEKFIVPELEAECEFLDDVTFHLDGPGAIKHLERICAIPNLKGIQWTPGAGQPPAAEWLPLLRYIQRKGKLLCLHDHISKAEKLIRGLSPRGLWIWFEGGASSREEALDLLRLARQWAGSDAA